MCVLSVLVSRPQWLNYAIAGRAGSHHTYVVFLERRDRKPTIDVVERVARCLLYTSCRYRIACSPFSFLAAGAGQVSGRHSLYVAAGAKSAPRTGQYNRCLLYTSRCV